MSSTDIVPKLLWIKKYRCNDLITSYLYKLVHITWSSLPGSTTAPVNPRSPATLLGHYCLAPPPGLQNSAGQEYDWCGQTTKQSGPLISASTRSSPLFPMWCFLPCRPPPPPPPHPVCHTQSFTSTCKLRKLIMLLSCAPAPNLHEPWHILL